MGKGEPRNELMNDLSKNMVNVKGFTIIELMITIAIMAILVAMAVPAYNDYTIRSKIGECVNGAAVAKIGVSEYRQSLGAWPPNLEETGLSTSGASKFCTAIVDYQPTTGAFTIDINEAVIDAKLAADSISPVLIPTPTATSIINWRCARGTTQASNLKYLPSTCRGT